MKREFLSNLKVGGAALPDVVIDAIMAEHQRDLDAAKADPGANGGSGEKTFTQEEVNRIVSDRLAKERGKASQQPQEDEREKALKARETRLDCRDYLDSKKYPAALLEILECSDVEQFKTTVDALAKSFPDAFTVPAEQRLSGASPAPVPPMYASGTGRWGGALSGDPVADAFKPQT